MPTDLQLLKQELEQTRNEYWNIDPTAGEMLQTLLFITKPKYILEIGTSNGYSALLMAQIASTYGGHITTIEFSEKRLRLAKHNLERAGLLSYVTFLQGDALQILSSLTHQENYFDFFFIDANKKQYVDYIASCIKLSIPGAIIVADNTISHRDQLNEFFNAIKKESSISVIEITMGTGLLIGTINVDKA